MTDVTGIIVAAVLSLVAMSLTFLRFQENRKLKLAVQQFERKCHDMGGKLSEIESLNFDPEDSEENYPNPSPGPRVSQVPVQDLDSGASNIKHLFLSHASEDKEQLVRPVANELQRRNLSVWLDEGVIVPGGDFVDAIQAGMKHSDATVVFVTEHFLKKRWPLLELNKFIAMGKPLIPVVCDISVNKVLERYPLLSSTYMMLTDSKVADAQEIGRRIERAYNFLKTHDISQVHLADSLETSRGAIKLPADGSTVDRHILAEGSLLSIPETARLWLVEEIGGLKWPKEPGIFISGNAWTGEAFEGGTPPGGRFTLSLYVVGESGQAQIQHWLDEGHQTDDYPGLSVIKDSRKLDSVHLRLRTG